MTAAPTGGYASPPQFDEASDKWPAYQVRLEAFFEGNGITEDNKKRALLVTALSTHTVDVLSGRCAPDKVNELSYPQVIALLKQHFSPQPNEIAQSYKFFTRNQLPGEPVKDFVVAIRQIADTCNFGASLDRMLRDRIVCGLHNVGVRRQLLAKPQLTRSEAEEIAISTEMAEANAQEIVSPTAEASVHALGGQSYRPRSRPQIVGCYRCGAKGHGPEDCRFRSASCFKCKQRGHIARACCRRESGFGVVPPERQVHALSREEDTGTDGMFALEAADSHIGHVGITQPIVRTLDCGGVPVNMQVDTGSPVSVITWPTYERNKTVWPKLRGSPLKLTCFLGRLPVRGQLQLKVSCGNKSTAGSLQVLGCSGPNLCGRDLIQAFHMLEAPVMNVNTSGEQLPLLGADDVNVDRLLAEFADVFAPGLGLIKGPPVHFETRENVVPKFWKAREVPYAFRPKVDAELDRLSGAGIIVPVPHAEWAAPVVPVVKRNGCIRLCGDFKLTVNKACRTEQYPLPRVEDILATLNGGEVFTTIDLREAYNQLPLDEEAMHLTTINTHKGLFSFTRLPFGVASAPAVFQRRMETILQGLPGVQVYLDDVIVAEKRNDCTTLHEVFKRFREYGVRLNADKCKFRQLEVDFLGHRISARGLQPKTENIDAILKVQAPRNSAELRSYLGMVTYYHKFLPNASTAMAPLYQLLRKEAKWKWDTAQQQSFSSVKDLLKSADFLAHFDPHKPLVLECDASPDGIGAVLSHDVGGGVLRPIGFRSRLLTGAEKNYSQLEREALALVFGASKFRQYLLGNTFTLMTDHKPLVALFHPDRPVPVMAAARIQRWALLLSAYDYVIKHQPGKDNIPADALSRLPTSATSQPETQEETVDGEYVLLTETLNDGVMSAKQLGTLTELDDDLAKVQKWVQEGWPRNLGPKDQHLMPYFNRKAEITGSYGLLYWGHRVIVPKSARAVMLRLLHDTHQGICSMKRLGRSLMWYPRIDNDIEHMVKSCTSCIQAAPMPPKKPPVAWPETDERWSRLHIDFAGPIDGHMLLIVVDSHSKWIEAIPMKSSTTHATIEALRTLFSTFGLPRTLVSDNGPQFTSWEFNTFTKLNNIVHLRTAPYHPQSNGLAERAVRTVKYSLKKNVQGSLKTRLARILHRYRRTPQAGGRTPAQLLMGYDLRSRLDNAVSIPPSPVDRPPLDGWQPGEPVWVRNFGRGEPWTPASITSTDGARLVNADGPEGETIRRHSDQVKPRELEHDQGEVGDSRCLETAGGALAGGTPRRAPTRSEIAGSPSTPVLRRSGRQRKPPDRYSP